MAGDLRHPGPVAFAAQVAPAVDRVAIGVHVASRSEAAQVLRRFGLPSAVPLIELRLGLPLRPIPLVQARAVLRYVAEADFQAHLLGQVAAGILTVRDEHIALTGRGQECCTALAEVHERTADVLWRGRAQSLPRLGALAGRLLTAAQADAGPAFRGSAPSYEPVGASPGLLLFGQLCALRLHRADAHAAAWAEAGLSAEQIQALPAGAQRGRIEVRTNELAAPPYASLSETERRAFLAGLVALGSA
ncbi:MAG: hypothetical protein ACR2J0_09020 [Mycobacteriales bacterium]